MNILFVRFSGPVSGFALWDFPQAHNVEDDPSVGDKLLRRLREIDKILPPPNHHLSCLETFIVLLTVLKGHGTSNAHTHELLHSLATPLLPKPNTLPTTKWAATRLPKSLGLSYQIIHACLQGKSASCSEAATWGSIDAQNVGSTDFIGEVASYCIFSHQLPVCSACLKQNVCCGWWRGGHSSQCFHMGAATQIWTNSI